MITVQVLLSTYNGTRWLTPLVDSVLAQDHPGVRLLARDDGSTDGTRELLNELQRQHAGRVEWFSGDNVGPQASFFSLLERADPGAAFFAFCDQDDIWLPDKLSRAVELLGTLQSGAPRMYCGRQRLVDEQLNTIGLSRIPRRGPAFANALVENIATGCTVVIDAETRRALRRRVPASPVMHDWWAYLVTCGLGNVVYDPQPKVLYRQHGANVVGAQHVAWRNWLARIERFRRHRERYAVWEQATELRTGYGEALSPDRLRLLDRFIARREAWSNGLRYALRPDVFRQARIDDWILRALMALGRI